MSAICALKGVQQEARNGSPVSSSCASLPVDVGDRSTLDSCLRYDSLAFSRDVTVLTDAHLLW